MATATNPLRGKLDDVNENIESVRTEVQKEWKVFEQARDEFASAGNDASRVDSDEFIKMDEIHKRYSVKQEELSGLEKTRDGIFRMLDTGPGAEEKRQERAETKEVDGKSLADHALESDEYKRLKESGALESDRQPFNAKLAQGSEAELKALITGGSDTSAGAFVVNDQKPYVAQPRRVRSVLNLITTGSTNSDTVEFARQTAFTNVAAETAEATDVTRGTKPEATIAFEKVTAAVRNIAHWVPATRRALADAGQLRTLIESQLRYGLEYRLETQVVNGAGTGEDLPGILNTSNILSQAKSTDSVADAIHKAITQIRLGFIEPNGVALHPNDWQILRLSRDDGGATPGTGAYLYGPPSTAGSEMIWGLPVAVSAAVPDDTGVVGDFRYATLWLREGMQVLASDSHDDFFVKNLVALLAEMRAAFGVTLPQAFCKVTSLD